ncbi:MAG TPA: hypothetical protein VGH89_13710 [Pseudonocardia sp.]|jgi:hypothetical protein
MQRRLRITIAVAAAVSSVALTAGTALADDGPINVNNDGSNSSHSKTPNLDKSNLDLPEVGGALAGH